MDRRTNANEKVLKVCQRYHNLSPVDITVICSVPGADHRHQASFLAESTFAPNYVQISHSTQVLRETEGRFREGTDGNVTRHRYGYCRSALTWHDLVLPEPKKAVQIAASALE